MNPTPLPLAGRHALVTGGARGIGLACARALLQRGARVTLLGRDGAALDAATDSLARLGQVQAVSADIADEASVRAAFAQAEVEFGPVQVLVNNAGQAVSERFDRTDSALWQSMIAVNLTGTFNCIRAALPGMLKEKWGRVINVASTAGLIGYGYVSAYCAAKHGVVGLTRSLALEVALKGVTVNAVCPGYTETDIVRGAVSNIVDKTGMSPEAARAKLAERNPQGRLIQPEEVAETVAWLALPASASVNGQAIAVDGGEVMTG
ncbi:SDR family NAD(P)-dependent oxidoreductase [Achromobacter denitrificans]|uniref:SDR family NAD(P)-dependent oxidoreductase n=1 Tax=Achromobacter denitrificans TaxID=32002 RepID=UPI0014696EC7|nr:SDR family NAD(P)-dependent oxidoreductase [Achromobacter denitrificans]CAB3910924.1 D-beta-hydroxybutyrate dehydrogenase [Achromobacter denitrificans]